MIPKIRKYIRKNKDTIINVIIVLAIVVIMLGLYKVLFYSSKESSVYGVRLRDSEKYKISITDQKKMKTEVKKIEGVESVDIEIKGRLIKYYITVSSSSNLDNMRNICNQVYGLVDENKKTYYDLTFYLITENEGEEKYPLVGYKHKNKEVITFVEGGKNE